MANPDSDYIFATFARVMKMFDILTGVAWDYSAWKNFLFLWRNHDESGDLHSNQNGSIGGSFDLLLDSEKKLNGVSEQFNDLMIHNCLNTLNQSLQRIINTQIIQRKWLSTSVEFNSNQIKLRNQLVLDFFPQNTFEPSQTHTKKNNTIYNTLGRLNRRRLDSDTGAAEDQVQWESMIVHTTIARWTIFPVPPAATPQDLNERMTCLFINVATTRRAVSCASFRFNSGVTPTPRAGTDEFVFDRSAGRLVGRGDCGKQITTMTPLVH